MENKELEKAIDTIIDMGIATEDEILLVTCINGYNIDTINDIVYARTGYRDIEQILEETEN